MNKRVLILDNDKDVLDILQEVFTSSGFDVKAIDESVNVFEEVNTYKPDVVLLDYILNGINGGEICHQLKTNKATSNMPVVIVSAHNRVIQSLGNYGSDAFIAKPFDIDDLVQQVNSLLVVESDMNSTIHH